MKEGRIELNKAAIVELLKSEEVAGVVKKHAEETGGKITKEFRGIDRYHVFVRKEGERND